MSTSKAFQTFCFSSSISASGLSFAHLKQENFIYLIGNISAMSNKVVSASSILLPLVVNFDFTLRAPHFTVKLARVYWTVMTLEHIIKSTAKRNAGIFSYILLVRAFALLQTPLT